MLSCNVILMVNIIYLRNRKLEKQVNFFEVLML